MLILAAAMALALSTPKANAGCQSTFQTLLNDSTKLANRRQYAEAAALREAVAEVSVGCENSNDGARGAFYPFDGASAYLIAADFWHAAGFDFRAQSALERAATALRIAQQSYHGSKDDFYEGHKRLLQQMIEARHAGKWGVWQ